MRTSVRENLTDFVGLRHCHARMASPTATSNRRTFRDVMGTRRHLDIIRKGGARAARGAPSPTR